MDKELVSMVMSEMGKVGGKKGGKSKSEAKAKAARENGRKGGRPPVVSTIWYGGDGVVSAKVEWHPVGGWYKAKLLDGVHAAAAKISREGALLGWSGGVPTLGLATVRRGLREGSSGDLAWRILDAVARHSRG